MNMKSSRSQLILFIVISYAYLWLLFGIGRLFEIPFSYDFRKPGGILVILGVPSSLFAASFVTLITHGKGALRQLICHSLNLRFGLKWYLSALLTPLLVAFMCSMAALWINDLEISKNWFSPSMHLGFMAFLLVYIGLGEEIGWRGFALPRFQESLGSFTGSVIPAILFHISVNFLAFTIHHPDQYFYLFWGITAVIAAAFLPRPMVRLGKRF